MNMSKKTLVHIGTVILFVGGIFFLGAVFGFYQRPIVERVSALSSKEAPFDESFDFSHFWKAWMLLESKHVASGDDVPSVEDRVYGAIQGLAGAYKDPYTAFFPPEESKMFHDSLMGEFSGVGMEMGMRDGVITVVAPLKNTPAYRADIQPGDVILHIDKTSTSGMAVDTAVSLIRGEKGTPVTLSLYREGIDTPFDVTLIRDTIVIPTLETKVIESDIFVMSIYTFTEQTPSMMAQALREMDALNLKKMIIDVRGNPGGFLNASVDMASYFVPSGKPIVREVFGEASREIIYRSKGFANSNSEKDIVVLIDKGSASASEIFAGALQHYGIAQLVGTETYGKGSVQELVSLTKDTSLKITIAQWVLPSGDSLSEKGLTPDVHIQYERNEDKTIDNQMNKAVELLLKK
jgi:carboxyl-terminal processing protease